MSNRLQIHFPTCLFLKVWSLSISSLVLGLFSSPNYQKYRLEISKYKFFSFTFLNFNFCPSSLPVSPNFHLMDRYHLGFSCELQMSLNGWKPLICWNLLWTSPVNVIDPHLFSWISWPDASNESPIAWIPSEPLTSIPAFVGPENNVLISVWSSYRRSYVSFSSQQA